MKKCNTLYITYNLRQDIFNPEPRKLQGTDATDSGV